MNMASTLMIKSLMLASLLLVSCGGPAALVTDRSGSQMLVEKIKSDGKPLLFRHDGITSELNLKKLSYLEIVPGVTKVYSGDSWQSTSLSYVDDEKKTVYNGWIPKRSLFLGKCPAGPCEMSVSTLGYLDFVMEVTVEGTEAGGATDATEGTATEPTGE